MREIGADYRDSLQLIAVDDEPAGAMSIELADYTVMTLRGDDRLIRIPRTS